MKQKKLISLFVLILQSLFVFANNISENEIKTKENIKDLVGKNLLAKVGSICYETPSADYSIGAEIFLKINIGKEYITIIEKEVEKSTDKKSESVKNNYSKEQRVLYEIKDNKIVIDYKNNRSLSNYELLYLEFRNKKITGHININGGMDKEVEFWEDLTSIYNQELVTLIDKFNYKSGHTGYVFMRVKIVGDNIFFSTGIKTPPCGTIEYGKYKQYSYTQQKSYIQLHFTSKQKKEEGYKLLLLSIKDGGILGSVKMIDNKIKQIKFTN